MNEDFFRYKKHFITIALLLGYAYMHMMLTGVYIEVTLDHLMDLSVRMPFGQRVLVPLMAKSLSYLLPLKPTHIFFLMEWLFTSLFYFALLRLLREAFSPPVSQLLSWLFLLLLPLVTVVSYRYSTQSEATFFYPYDTASILFMTLGFLFCLREKWLYFMGVLFLATINRETSLLLVLMIPALHWQKRHLMVKPMILALGIYAIARLLIFGCLKPNGGSLLEFYFHNGEQTHFEANLNWLLNQQHLLLFSFCFAGLPLFWFAFYDYIPIRFRPLRYVAFFYFGCLLLVANFMEARVFSEILILIYFPICIGVQNWLSHSGPFIGDWNQGILHFLDRYAILTLLTFTIICRFPLNKVLLWFLH